MEAAGLDATKKRDNFKVMVKFTPLPSVVFACILLAAPSTALQSQTPQVWLKHDGGYFPYFSITAAALASVSGDTIFIRGMVDAAGAPKAYSLATSGESFPITIPAGVTVKPLDGTPVFVAIDITDPAVEILTSQAVPGPTPPQTRIEQLRLGGANVAISASAAANQQINAVLEGIRFGVNTTGLLASATGGTISIQVNNCRVVDGNPLGAPIPQPRLFTSGLVFQANDAAMQGPPGLVDADVTNLETVGTFALSSMQGTGFTRQAGSHDLTPFGNFTRLISVLANGDTNNGIGEHNGFALANPGISRVILRLNGGVLDGKSLSASTGWDVGVYADTQSPAVQILDYCSAWEVTITGSQLRNFRAAGVYGETYIETRGKLTMSQAIVERIGAFSPATTDTALYSGLLLASTESYLSVEAANCSFLDNQGSGAYFHAHDSIQAAEMYFPTGLFTDLQRCASHGNQRNGLHFDAAPNKPHFPRIQGATVGGAHDFYPSTYRSLIDRGGEPDPNLERGQGVVNRCDISNNGDYGVLIEATGSYFDGPEFTAASVRFVNTYIWNNPDGGFFSRLTPVSRTENKAPLLVSPLVHCTLAYNGPSSGAGWTMEVEPVNIGAGPPDRSFFWDDDPFNPLPHPEILVTSLNNTIFQRAVSTDGDFGGNLDAIEIWDQGVPGTFWWGASARIGRAGLRGSYVPDGVDPKNTVFACPFAGPINPGGRTSSQWFLNQNGQAVFYESNNYLRAGFSLSEDAADYEGVTRPAYPLRDKGGEED